MTNTYEDDANLEEKTYEELRCIRCLLERKLQRDDPMSFVDYQMEKFGKDYKTKKAGSWAETMAKAGKK